MAKPGDVIEVPDLGVRFEVRATAESTGGEYAEFDTVGRVRGFIRVMHVHAGVTERHEVIEGVLRIKLHGKVHVLRAGEALDIPPDTPHYQRPGADGTGRIRVRHTPAGRVEDFLEALGAMSRAKQFNRVGFPRPLAGAAFVRDFGESGYAARPSLQTQKRLANAVLKLTDGEYTFVDEWDVHAPAEDVFDALADGTTYPEWWKPVYIDVTADGDFTHQHFKGRLPYHLHTRTRTVRSERPHRIQGETDGDLRGTGIWTLTRNDDGGTHVRFDWRVHADRRLLKLLTPVLRPALRWNHNWAIARAVEGLEPYVQSHAKVAA
jgi:uncharacterized protein YndB with AHSA1/START domain/mannose-6-phosphate isomerase-like protein (cupin superfamily)